MPKQMTERAAWLYLAKRWDKAVLGGDGDAMVRINTDRTIVCLCDSILRLQMDERIDVFTESCMVDRIQRLPNINQSSSYKWPRTLRGARSRAAFCRRMAKQCGKKAVRAKAAK
jgi:hypothetical protein